MVTRSGSRHIGTLSCTGPAASTVEKRFFSSSEQRESHAQFTSHAPTVKSHTQVPSSVLEGISNAAGEEETRDQSIAYLLESALSTNGNTAVGVVDVADPVELATVPAFDAAVEEADESVPPPLLLPPSLPLEERVELDTGDRVDESTETALPVEESEEEAGAVLLLLS